MIVVTLLGGKETACTGRSQKDPLPVDKGPRIKNKTRAVKKDKHCSVERTVVVWISSELSLLSCCWRLRQ